MPMFLFSRNSNPKPKTCRITLMTFCSLAKYNENPIPIRLFTNPWPIYRTRPFTDLWEVSIEHLWWVYIADRGRFLLLTPGPVPFWTCICSTCWDQSFSRTCIFPDYWLRTSFGTFSMLLCNWRFWKQQNGYSDRKCRVTPCFESTEVFYFWHKHIKWQQSLLCQPGSEIIKHKARDLIDCSEVWTVHLVKLLTQHPLFYNWAQQ